MWLSDFRDALLQKEQSILDCHFAAGSWESFLQTVQHLKNQPQWKQR